MFLFVLPASLASEDVFFPRGQLHSDTGGAAGMELGDPADPRGHLGHQTVKPSSLRERAC
jgi:hypothetical protein